MNATTVSPAEASTGSRTMADMLPLAAERHGTAPALRHKVGDQWCDVSYGELGAVVREVALGLVDLGIEKGERVAILANTRPEWTYANFGILCSGATSVSIYQTNSPEECHYVLHHSESRSVFVEDREQLEKVRKVRSDLPALEHVIVMDPGADAGDIGDAISLADLRERGRSRDHVEFDDRVASVGPDDTCVFMYTSGTTGPPKGCILTHGNYRQVTSMAEQQGVVDAGDSVYLFLPLAHAFALLVQFVTIDLGATLAYWERDPQRIVPNLMELKPTYFPSVPRIFEKIYTMATANAEDQEKLRQAVQMGIKVRELRTRGEEVPAELQAAFDQAEEKLFSNVRNLFGGRIRQCVTGAAPIAKEILEFFYACGVPVLEGYGMTETSTVATVNELDAPRFGSVGKPLPGQEVRIADDGEILLKGPNIFQGYYKNDEATRETLEDGWLHTGDLGHIDEDGFVYISGRKKDIIITAGGKNITPANLENGLKQSRWISQAVVIGDRRPYLVALVTLDPEEVPKFAEQHGIAPEEVAGSREMREEVQRAVDTVNATVGPVEQIKRFTILSADLSQETGELTPTLKVKRNVVGEKYEREVEELYAG
ncbi:MAG TPA: long-chain fatty acid--CoA ligase [Thermoleophilaceae bacterium]|nr:long-chain fatty acid--CoA ligase [Thermoleophilaceae bacterium]